MSLPIPPNSRLRLGNLIDYQGVQFWDLLVLPPVPEDPNDIFHTVISGDRIDLLAWHYYQDSTLWWYIAVANDLELLPVDLIEGDIIRIPSILFYPLYMAKRRTT